MDMRTVGRGIGITLFICFSIVTGAADAGGFPSAPATLTAPQQESGSLFGNALALSGTRLAVGAPFATVGGLTHAGIVHVYEYQGGNWQHAAAVGPDVPLAEAWFGDVALEGNRLVAGASREAQNVGALYVFDRDPVTGIWEQKARLRPSNPTTACNDPPWGCHLFGNSVALDGDTVAAGAPTENTRTGAAYVFTRTAQDQWQLQARLTPGDPVSHTQFGNAIAIDGDTVLVGAHFRTIGSNDDQGAAYVYTRDIAGTWTQQARLVASDGAAADIFGFSVDLDGDTALIGARLADVGASLNRGAVYVFTRTGTTWTQRARLIASDGVGVGTGSADGDHFGYRVRLRDGRALIARHPGSGNVPAPDRNGAVYRFDGSSGVWTEQDHFTPKDGSPGDSFGVALDFGRRWIAVGAQYEGTPPDEVEDRGVVYVYDTWPDDRIFADGWEADR